MHILFISFCLDVVSCFVFHCNNYCDSVNLCPVTITNQEGEENILLEGDTIGV